MKGYEALAEAIVREGVDTVFGLLGGGVLQLSRILADRHGIRFVAARHEEVAVGMADGYSRATGKVGVAIICLGPGLANAGAAMLAARMSGSRVLVVVGAAGFAVDPHNNMSFDQPPFLQATIGAMQQIRSAETLAYDVRAAFNHVRLGRGPIALQFPLTDAEMPASWSYAPTAGVETMGAAPQPSAADISALVEMIEKSERPVILLGRGAWLSGAGDALVALAERTGALLASTLLTKNWRDDDPYHVGISGGFSSAGATDLLAETDLLIAFGASLNSFTFGHGALFGKARLAQVDTNPGAFGEYRPVDLAVCGDALATATALLETLPATRSATWRTAETAERIARIDRWQGLDMTERHGAANPRRVIQALDAELPLQRLLITDIGLFMAVPAAHMRVAAPDGIVFPWQLGRIGCALPVAMGAAVGRPDHVAVCFVGDGGMMAALAGLDTLATLGLPLLLVVMDDDGLGAERRLFDLAGQQSNIADHRTPDLVSLARSLNLTGAEVKASTELPSVLAGHDVRKDGPMLLRVKIDSSVPTTEMDIAYYTPSADKSGVH